MKDILKTIVGQLPIILVVIFLLWDRDKVNYNDIFKELNQKDSIYYTMIDTFMGQQRKITEHTNREFSHTTIVHGNTPEMVDLRAELAHLNIKIKDLKSAIELNTTVTGQGSTQVVRVADTLDTYTFADSTDKHLNISGKVDVSSGLMDYKYTYSANYKLFSYDYKKNFFKRPELRLKMVSDDPRSDISAKTFTVKPPRDLFSVSVGAGAALTYANGKAIVRPAIILGITKAIYTFRTKK